MPDSSSVSQCYRDTESFRVLGWLCPDLIECSGSGGCRCPSMGVFGRVSCGVLWSPSHWPSASNPPPHTTLAKSCLIGRRWLWRSCIAGHTYHDSRLRALSLQAKAYSGCTHWSGKPSNRTKLPDTMAIGGIVPPPSSQPSCDIPR